MLAFDENEITFDPRISARAEIRERNEEGPVTISMIVDNEPLRGFTARFESNPPLSQAEIFGVLGQSILTPSGETDPNAVQIAALTTVDIFTNLGLWRLERVVRDKLGLDMFSIRTSLLRNFASISWGLAPVDRSVSFGNYFDNTTVYIGKYVGADMFVQGMVSIRYEDTAGFQSGIFRTGRGFTIGKARLEPDIGIELNTPLFDIRWNMAPYHLENLFIDDMSFTLVWRWTFR